MMGTVQSRDLAGTAALGLAFPQHIPVASRPPAAGSSSPSPRRTRNKLKGLRSNKGKTSQIFCIGRGAYSRQGQQLWKQRVGSRQPTAGHTRRRTSVPLLAAAVTAVHPSRVRVAAPHGAQAAALHRGWRSHRKITKSF